MATKKTKPADMEAEVTENVATEEMITEVIRPPKQSVSAKCQYIMAGKHSRIYFEDGKYLDRFVPGREFTVAEAEAMTSEKEIL